MTVVVDGREVTARGTVLATCRGAGADVPALCHRDEVPGSGGHCRACLVEVDGHAVAACTTPARDGTVVTTDSPRLRAYRRDLGALLCAEATPAGALRPLVEAWSSDPGRYQAPVRAGRRDDSHPYLRLDLDTCIRCRLCEEACAGIQGRFVFAFQERGARTELGWGGHIASSACVGCGACAAACPTGAIGDVDRARGLPVEQRVRTTCAYCGVGCQLDVAVSGGEVAFIDGAPVEPNRGHLCVKGRYAHRFVHHRDRLTTPLVRRDGVLVPCSWDEAIAAVAAGLRRAGAAVGALSSSRCSNEENYLLQKWIRGGLGSNNVDCCARVCHAPSARGMRESFGTGAATNSFADVDVADLVLVVGANVTEAHPVIGARIAQRALAGTALVVIDPRRTELAALADVHLQVRPGSNVALLNSMAHVLVYEGLVDEPFVTAHTTGFDVLRAFLADYSPERTQSVTDVPALLVRRAARLYGEARRPMQVHGLGVTEHYQGSEAVMLLCNLALLVGAVGRPGVGVNPLRGQNNVQGAADMGCQPDLVTGYGAISDPAVRARVEAVWGRPLPAAPGLTMPQMYEAASTGALRALFVLGEDIAQTDPSVHVEGALASLDLLVVQELFLSETARRAHVVLPGASFLEKDGTFTSGERRIQRVRRALPPVAGARPDWQILCDLMAATGWPQRYAHPSEVLDEIAAIAPPFAGVGYDRLESGGLQWPVPSRDHPGTPLLHQGGFARGRAPLICVAPASSPALTATSSERYPLLLTTGRVLEHYNSGSMTRRTGNTALRAADTLELSAVDARRHGIGDGDWVAIESPWGAAQARAAIAARIAPGSAFLSFHFPETGTNRLTSPVRDRLADCPEYKVVPVRVKRL